MALTSPRIDGIEGLPEPEQIFELKNHEANDAKRLKTNLTTKSRLNRFSRQTKRPETRRTEYCSTKLVYIKSYVFY